MEISCSLPYCVCTENLVKCSDCSKLVCTDCFYDLKCGKCGFKQCYECGMDSDYILECAKCGQNNCDDCWKTDRKCKKCNGHIFSCCGEYCSDKCKF